MIFSRLPATLALAGALLAGPAFAAPTDQPPTAVVRYADLDLSSQAGKAELQHRLNRAVAAVCPAGTIMQLETVVVSNACRKTARANIAQKAQAAIALAETRQRLASAESVSRPAGL